MAYVLHTMCPKEAAAEYVRLSLIAESTDWGSDEWKAATAFAHRFEDTATESDFDEYLNELESLNNNQPSYSGSNDMHSDYHHC